MAFHLLSQMEPHLVLANCPADSVTRSSRICTATVSLVFIKKAATRAPRVSCGHREPTTGCQLTGCQDGLQVRAPFFTAPSIRCTISIMSTKPMGLSFLSCAQQPQRSDSGLSNKQR